jgi:membrane protein implicated in regulation of membrane protease activity
MISYFLEKIKDSDLKENLVTDLAFGLVIGLVIGLAFGPYAWIIDTIKTIEWYGFLFFGIVEIFLIWAWLNSLKYKDKKKELKQK